MPGQRGVNGDLGCFAVADLPHQDHVRILADNGPQSRCEGQTDLPVYLDLAESVELVLHRVLDGDDVLVLGIDSVRAA